MPAPTAYSSTSSTSSPTPPSSCGSGRAPAQSSSPAAGKVPIYPTWTGVHAERLVFCENDKVTFAATHFVVNTRILQLTCTCIPKNTILRCDTCMDINPIHQQFPLAVLLARIRLCARPPLPLPRGAPRRPLPPQPRLRLRIPQAL